MVIDSITLRENFLSDVKELVNKKDWRRIVQLTKKYEISVTSEFLWTFPTEYCLHYLKALWKSFNITNVLSVGCGSGLLEFVMRESMGVKITGLEVDRNWWLRKTTFIPLKFLEPDQSISSQFLLDTTMMRNWNFALMFCYFNNREAFNEYVNCFKGTFIIIIGPADNTFRYTEPLPLDKEFEKNENYKLIHFSEFGNNRDLIAIYEKIGKNMYV